MNNFTISLNQLSEYISASEARKRAIIKQQVNPSPFVVQWYKSARSAMQKCIKNGFSKSEIISAIENLKLSKPDTKFKKSNVRGSIEALNVFLRLHFPDQFQSIKFSFVKANSNLMRIEGVDVRIVPDVILRAEINGRKVLGGIMFRISKGHGFEALNCICAATAMKLFLEKHVVDSNEIVEPSFCISVDVFSERVVSAPKDSKQFEQILAKACKEISLKLNSSASKSEK